MNTAFLLGAGSSVAAGFPSTEELTQQILSGCDVKRHTDESYYIDSAGSPDEVTQFANCMVRQLHAEAERYYSAYGGRHTNYEDLYYLAKQVLDEESGEMENPAIHSFVGELRTNILPLLKVGIEIDEGSRPYVSGVPYNFQMLLKEVISYIADIVWRKLCHKPDPESISHLNIIVNACNSININQYFNALS